MTISQTAMWNGTGGQGWVEAQDLLEQLFLPFEQPLVEAVSVRHATRVLDIGCGTGSTTLAVAQRLGKNGHCTGVDISEPMITAAQARAERENTPAEFIRADAQAYAFQPQSFDMILSRFGVMFFNDPVQAFSNLRRAAKENAGLRFIAWRSGAENPFMTAAERAAEPLLPNLPVRTPDEPGQFAFADRSRIHSILTESGWDGIDIQPMDVPCTMPESELLLYLTRLGPVGRALQDVDEPARRQVIETVRAAFDPYVHGTEVQFTAACWMVSARVA